MTAKSSLKLLMPVILLLGIVSSQYFFDLQKRNRPISRLTIIPAQALKTADLGLDLFFSALMWIYTIQQVIDWPQELPKLIGTVNDLDPKFSYPYAFAALVLPGLDLPPEEA